MKILIGYDGSDFSEAALRDLTRAGLPGVGEALIMSVADVFQPPPIKEEDTVFPLSVRAGVWRADKVAAEAIGEARDMAEGAKATVLKLLPGWQVISESCAESPAWALIKKADEWKPDLIVVGSASHVVMGGRVILGSVSQRVLYEARSSVRIARASGGQHNIPVRIVIGVDGSPSSYAALDEVASRSWPRGSEVRVVMALDTVIFLTPISAETKIVKWFEVANENDLASLRQIMDGVLDKLRKADLATSLVFKKGNPKLQLIEEAESWSAHSIFVGAKGMRGVDRLLLGSVSASVAAGAPCSVEVVRVGKA